MVSFCISSPNYPYLLELATVVNFGLQLCFLYRFNPYVQKYVQTPYCPVLSVCDIYRNEIPVSIFIEALLWWLNTAFLRITRGNGCKQDLFIFLVVRNGTVQMYRNLSALLSGHSSHLRSLSQIMLLQILSFICLSTHVQVSSGYSSQGTGIAR